MSLCWLVSLLFVSQSVCQQFLFWHTMNNFCSVNDHIISTVIFQYTTNITNTIKGGSHRAKKSHKFWWCWWLPNWSCQDQEQGRSRPRVGQEQSRSRLGAGQKQRKSREEAGVGQEHYLSTCQISSELCWKHTKTYKLKRFAIEARTFCMVLLDPDTDAPQLSQTFPRKKWKTLNLPNGSKIELIIQLFSG